MAKNGKGKRKNTQQRADKGASSDGARAIRGLGARAKCIVSFALQKNFGYGVQEAVYLGCVPALPDRLAYVEQFSKEYRYSCFDECVELVGRIMTDEVKPASPVVTDNDKVFDVWFEGL